MATIIGTSGADLIGPTAPVFTTTGGSDIIDGLGGTDTIDAAGGDDLVKISGANDAQNDIMDGGDGFDTLRNESGVAFVLRNFNDGEQVKGFEELDGKNRTLLGDATANVFNFSGVELFRLSTIDVGANSDTIIGSNFDNATYLLGGGNDKFTGTGSSRDTVDGGDNNDTISTGGGVDVVTGGSGVDTIDLGDDDDIARIFSANDAQTDIMHGGDGFDTFENRSTVDFVLRNFNDGTQVSGFEKIDGFNRDMVGDATSNFFNLVDVELFRVWDIRTENNADMVAYGGSYTDRNIFADGGNSNDTLRIVLSLGELTDAALIDEIRDYRQHLQDGKAQQVFTFSEFGGSGNDLRAVSFETLEVGLGTGNGGFLPLGSCLLDADTIQIGTGSTPDVFIGTAGRDLMFGERGADTLEGRDGDDCLFGGNQKDTITGGRGLDRIDGGQDDDTIVVFRGDGEFDLVDGGINTDTVLATGTTNNNLIFDNFGAAGQYVNIERVDLNGIREIIGNDSANTFDFRGTSFIDLDFVGLKGGNDTLFASDRTDATYKGDGGNDTMTGGRQNDRFEGGDGNDTLSGGNGFDVLVGDGGNDTMSGGDRSDEFLFNGRSFGDDTITDFFTGNGPNKDVARFTNTNRPFDRFDKDDNGVINAADAGIDTEDALVNWNGTDLELVFKYGSGNQSVTFLDTAALSDSQLFIA